MFYQMFPWIAMFLLINTCNVYIYNLLSNYK